MERIRFTHRRPIHDHLRYWFAATLVALVAIGTTACAGPTLSGEDLSTDSTDWLGAAVWVLQGEVIDQNDVAHGVRNLDVVVKDVMFERDQYYWLERFDVPAITAGTILPLELTEPSTRVGLAGRILNFAVQAAGTPEELAAGNRHDGARPFSVQLVFDTDWSLIEAGGDHFETYEEVLALYPGSGLAKVGAFLDDARVLHQFDNEWSLLVDSYADPELAPRRDEGRPSTPGPLGEWRREKGHELPPIGSDESEILASWIASAPEARQLPAIGEEVVDGMADALGTSALHPRQAFVEVDAEFRSRYPWIGLRFVGVGVIGPFSTEADGLVHLSGYAPSEAMVELVAWREVTIVDLGSADVITVIEPEAWALSSVLWVELTGDIGGKMTATATGLSEGEAVARTGSLASSE